MSNRKGPRGQSESGGIAGGKSLFITKEGSGKTPTEDAKQDGNEAVKGREAPLTEIRCRSMRGLKRKIHYEQKGHLKKNVPPKCCISSTYRYACLHRLCVFLRSG